MVGAPRPSGIFMQDFIHDHAAGTRCRFKSVADADAFDGIDAHDGKSQFGIKFRIPADIAAKSCRHPFSYDSHDAAERVAFFFRF